MSDEYGRPVPEDRGVDLVVVLFALGFVGTFLMLGIALSGALR